MDDKMIKYITDKLNEELEFYGLHIEIVEIDFSKNGNFSKVIDNKLDKLVIK